MSEPLSITATLDTPIAFHTPIHFDALLMSAVAKRDNLPTPAHRGEVVEIEIPVARSACGRYYLASIGYCEVAAHEARHVNRRFPLEELIWLGDGKTKRVNAAAGAQKIYRIPMSTMHLKHSRVVWRCDGERTPIEDLLQLVTGLGRRRGVGLGAVREWLVEQCDTWPGFPVLDPDGLALRNLPLDTPGLCIADIDQQALEPPYWLSDRRTECAVPAWRA